MSNQFKTAIYCRAARADDEAIANQKAMLRNYAEENGHGEPSVYIDNGYSGIGFNRPALTCLNEDINAGLVKTVIVKDFSRLSRSAPDMSAWADNIRRKGVLLISVLEGPYDDSFSAIYNALLQAYGESQAKP